MWETSTVGWAALASGSRGRGDSAELVRRRQCPGGLLVAVLNHALVTQVKVEQLALELRLTPLTVLLRSVLDQLQEKDPARIFAQPVSLKEVGAHEASYNLSGTRPGGLVAARGALR